MYKPLTRALQKEAKGQHVRLEIAAERADAWATLYPLIEYNSELEAMKRPSDGPSWEFGVTVASATYVRVIRDQGVSIAGIKAVSADMGGYTCLQEGLVKDGAAFVMRIDK